MEFAADGTGERKKLMVVIDESEESYHVLMWVLDNLYETLNSSHRLLIFKAQAAPNYNNTFAASLSSARIYCSPVAPTADFVNTVHEQEKKVTEGLLQKAKSICTSRGINADTVIEVGDPKYAICNAVDKHKVNILVIAEEVVSYIKGTFKWSLSDYCVQYAKCPVLVIKRPEGETSTSSSYWKLPRLY